MANTRTILNLNNNQTYPQQIIDEDSLVDSWLLPSSPGLVVGLMLSYLGFVLYLGPRIMANRKPYDLKILMMTYNAIQVGYNFYLVTLMMTADTFTYLTQHYCHPMDIRLNPLRLEMCSGMWHYAVVKMLDLSDTVFFMLRKKNDHVTFLHVYHHAVMVGASWVSLKYIRGEQFVILGFMNAFVHVVMYSYYFLAAFGERVRPYLWWKKYLTILQIVQFVLGTGYLAALIVAKDCELSRVFTYFYCSLTTTFLALFLNFYAKTYRKHREANAKAH